MTEQYSNMGERMAVVETKLDDLKKDISEIKDILKASDNRFASKEEVESVRRDIELNRKWVYGIAMALITAIVAYAIKALFHI